jgi:hypothetical protein
VSNMTWWIAREGTLGQIVSSFTPSQITNLSVQWHVVQGATKPNATAQGPFATQALAQAKADSLNTANSGIAPAAAAVAQDAYHGLNLGTWILRIGEILLGIVLIGVGVAKLTGAENLVSKAAKVAAL